MGAVVLARLINLAPILGGGQASSDGKFGDKFERKIKAYLKILLFQNFVWKMEF